MTYLEQESAAQDAKIKAIEDELTVINDSLEALDIKYGKLNGVVTNLEIDLEAARHNILVLQEATRGMKLYKQVTNQEPGDGFYLDPNFIRQDVDNQGTYPEYTLISMQRADNKFIYDNKWLLK